ncbi:MAG: hypothetical protein S4CHLAM81_08080 [Chlamydiales bacterium]|nr:hypothetical protein [Chlamydiales bacterium]MCH9635590.1 hypothetical protein [Chlamydiales bacterium]
MAPYEQLIRELGELIGIQLQADGRQSCLIDFPNDGVAVQVDLDAQGDRLLIGCNLGDLAPGSHRELVFAQAMRVNALPRSPRGLLAYSDLKDSLILYQYMMLNNLTAAKLHNFLTRFVNHARLWHDAISRGDIPPIEETSSGGSNGMMGLS